MRPANTPIPLQAVNDLYVAWKKQNPTDDSSIKEFSQRFDGTAGFNLKEGKEASWINRKVMQADNLARPASQKLASKIRGGGAPTEMSFGDILANPLGVAQEGTAKGVEMLGSSLPSAALSMWALAGGNKQRALKTLGGLLPYGLISGYNETRDVPHAVTNAVSLAASPVLAQGAVGLATKKGAGRLGKALAGVVGGMTGDVAEIGAAPTANPDDSYIDRFQKNLPAFFKDPSNIISLGVAEGAFSATDPILRATERKVAERTNKVNNTPGLFSTSGKAANLKKLMQSEFNLDIPNGVPDSTLRLAADAARMGDTQEAQRKIYASIGDRLSEQQSSRFKDLQKLPEERLAEYTATVQRDWQAETPHLDEFSFEFKTDEDAREFINQTAEQDIPESSRLVGNKLFYWGTSDESLARLSQAARAGKVNKMSLRARVGSPDPQQNKFYSYEINPNQYTGVDKDYASSLADLDLDKARALLDKKAKEKGFTEVAFHGGAPNIKVFNDLEFGPTDESAHFGDISAAMFMAQDSLERTGQAGLYKVYLKGPFARVEDSGGAGWTDVTVLPDLVKHKIITKEEYLSLVKKVEKDFAATEGFDGDLFKRPKKEADYFDPEYLSFLTEYPQQYKKLLQKKGYRGLVYGNTLEGIKGVDSYAIFDPKDVGNIKLADLMTADEAGNLIPLSKRFDTSTPNIHFSLSGSNSFRAMQRQADEAALLDHETQVKLTLLQDEMARNGEVMSTAQFVKRVKSMTELGRAGSDFDVDVMLRALLRIAGPDKLVSVFNDNRTVNGFSTKGFSAEDSNVIGLNLNDSNVQDALQTVAHEMTHTSLADFRKNDPESYQQLEDAVMSLDVPSFEILLQESNRKFGTNLEVSYASGRDFDPNNPNFAQQVAEERMAAVSEIVIGRALGGQKTNKVLSALPVEVQRFVRNLMEKLRNWFTGDARYGRYLSPESKKIFDDVYNRLDKQVFHSEKAADKLAKMFQANEAFDPLTLGKPNLKELSKSGVLSMKLQKDYVNDLTFMEREGLSFAQKNLWSTLSLSKVFPVARPLFERLHNYRSDIQKQLMTYFSELGQDVNHSLSHEAAMDAFEGWVHKLALDNKRLEAISRVFEADQNRRKGQEVLPGESLKEGLVTSEEMRTDFKLSEEDAMVVERIRGLVERVAYQEFLDMSHRDYLNQATFLITQFGDTLNEAQAQEIGRNVTMLATEAAKLEVTARQAAGREDKIGEMKARRLANVRRSDLTNRLTEELSSAGVTLGKADRRVEQATKIALLQADYRIKHVMTTAKEGYAPQVRRGKFILRANQKDGESFVKGFDTKKQADAFWRANKDKLELSGGTVTEKSKLGNHYRHYTSETLQGIRRQFKNELNKIVSQFDPETMTEQSSEVIAQIQQQFGDMDKELSDALGQKADPFKLNRKDVAGFQKEDYLPNIFDYVNIKTIIGQKGVIAARAKFEMSKPEFYANKDLLEEFRNITDYTLNSKDSEWSGVRKFVYMYYLGASMRHLIQNLTQPFIIGVPELASVTKSFTDAPKRMAQAYKQVSEWNSKGTTGNKTLDRLMKQAEDEQVWNPTMLHHYLPTQDLAVGPVSQTAYLRGKSGFGKQVKIQAAKAGRAVQSVLQVTAESSEILNRQIAFAARANDVKDTATTKELENLYVEASRFTNDVNFVGDKSNRPGFVRRSGNAHGPLMFSTALMSFVINHLSLMGSYWNQITKGSVDVKTYKRNPDKFKLDNPGAYGLLMGAAMLTAFAGALGIPFSQDADEVIESFTGMRLSDMVRAGIIDLSEHFNFSEENGDLLADAAMNGLPGAVGVGMSQSVGLGRIFSFQTGQPFSFWDLLGAGGSVVERGLKGVSDISKDPTEIENWERGIRKTLPAGLQYWHELINVVKNNKQVDTEGRIVSNPLDAGGSVSRLMGFTPTEVTQQRGSEFRARRMEDRIRQERVDAGKNIGRMLFEASSTRSEKTLAKARKEYRDFVRKNKLTVAQRQSLVNSIATDVRARSGQVIDIPNNRMAQILSEIQESNPDYQPEVTTPLEKRQASAGVAQQLGDPIALKLGMPSSSSIKHQMLYEQLVKSGVNPVIAKMLADEDVEKLEQIRGTQLPSLRP